MNITVPTRERWQAKVAAYFTEADRWNFAAFPEHLATDITFRFGNLEPLHGLDTFLQFARAHQRQVASVAHTLKTFHADIEQRSLVVELDVHYQRLDRAYRSYPAAVALEFNNDDLITGYRVYIDPTGLVEPA
jgi:ketosteroid isomerase-like protein